MLWAGRSAAIGLCGWVTAATAAAPLAPHLILPRLPCPALARPAEGVLRLGERGHRQRRLPRPLPQLPPGAAQCCAVQWVAGWVGGCWRVGITCAVRMPLGCLLWPPLLLAPPHPKCPAFATAAGGVACAGGRLAAHVSVGEQKLCHTQQPHCSTFFCPAASLAWSSAHQCCCSVRNPTQPLCRCRCPSPLQAVPGDPQRRPHIPQLPVGGGSGWLVKCLSGWLPGCLPGCSSSVPAVSLMRPPPLPPLQGPARGWGGGRRDDCLHAAALCRTVPPG